MDKLPTIEDLNYLFNYDPINGLLYWKKRDEKAIGMGFHVSHNSLKWWNARYPGKEAGSNGGDGYLRIRIGSAKYLAHRIVFAMANKRWPTLQIDHIDGRKRNNAIINLREVTILENSRNQKIPKSNKSGHIGVSWLNRCSKWQANIKVNGRNISLGLFKKKEEAIAARKAAEAQYGFHQNHGARTAKQETAHG